MDDKGRRRASSSSAGDGVRRFGGSTMRWLRRTAVPVWWLVVLTLTACSSSETLTLEDDGGALEVEVGDRFEVVLAGNPTTGYAWEVEDLDTNVLGQQGEPGFEPESDLLGAPGEYRFVFEAVAPGTTRLELVHRRPFDPADELERFTVDVVCR